MTSDTPTSAVNRRQLLFGAAGTAVALGVAGCQSKPAASSAGEPAPAVTSGTFPATVTHKFGTTTIPAAPQRVVSVGVTEQDFLLAYGVKPVGVTEWYGNQPLATWPWARPLLGDAKPTVLSQTDGLEFEKIAGLQPDLIIGTNAGLDKKNYDRLAKIAPTIANSGKFSSGYFEPWNTQAMMIGQALGRPDLATTKIDALEQKFADAAKAHPEFTGKKVIFSQGGIYEGSVIASQEGLGTEFLTDLGLTIPKEITPYSKDGNQAYIPLEKLDLLDTADVLVWGTDDAAAAKKLQATPGFKQLKTVKAGRSIYTGPELAGAIYFASLLSLPMVVDRLVPMLSKALR